MRNDANSNTVTLEVPDQTKVETDVPELEETQQPGWREAFRVALDRARRQQKPMAGRRELGRDKSKSLVILLGSAVLLLLVFFALFSSPKKRSALPGENRRGQPSLGRKVTPGQENTEAGKTVAPMLSADIRSNDLSQTGEVTPEDVGRTARTGMASSSPQPKPKNSQDYAIGRVDFSDPLVGRGTTPPPPPAPPIPEHPIIQTEASDLKKPSIVFVRSAEAKPNTQAALPENDERRLALPAGTRLVARLEAPVSSATTTPAVAVVEYNYERNEEIVLPAGAKVFGRLAQVNSSGHVDLRFDRVELPDGTAEKIEASAMDLNFGPLKGYVSGKKGGTKFLVRSLTGIGTMASYLVGPQGSSSEGVLSTNTLMRERLADNMGTAGQEELNGLALNQNLVVTVPGNTRFYIVLQKPTSDQARAPSGIRNPSTNSASSGTAPTLEEMRQLLQLRREINELYTQTSSPPASQPQQP